MMSETKAGDRQGAQGIPQPISQNLSNTLDLARWLSALLVVLSHVRPLLFAEYGAVVDRNLGIALFYFFTGFGREAVVVFFVVSGFLVGGRSLEKLKIARFSLLEFLISRFARIYTVLLPSLIFGGVLDYIGFFYFNGSKIYTEAQSYGIDSIDAIYHQLEPSVFLGNLLMLQKIVFPVFGTNGPLWSLAFEWWYYMAFGVAMYSVRFKSSFARVFISVAALGFLALLSVGIFLGAGLWLIGLLASVASTWPLRKPKPWLCLVFFGAALVFSRAMAIKHDFGMQSQTFGFLKQVLIAASFAALLVNGNGKTKSFSFMAKINKRFADFSYTLYVLHFPLLVFMVAVLSSRAGLEIRMQPGKDAFVYFVGMTFFVYVVSLIFYFFTEKRTFAVRYFLVHLLNGRRERSA